MVGKHFGSKTKNILLAIHVNVHLHLPSAKQLFQMWTHFLPSLMTAFLTSHLTSLLTSHQTSSPQPSQLILHFLCPLFYCISLPMKSKIKGIIFPVCQKMIHDSDLYPSASHENLQKCSSWQDKKSCKKLLIIILFLFHKVCWQSLLGSAGGGVFSLGCLSNFVTSFFWCSSLKVKEGVVNVDLELSPHTLKLVSLL